MSDYTGPTQGNTSPQDGSQDTSMVQVTGTVGSSPSRLRTSSAKHRLERYEDETQIRIESAYVMGLSVGRMITKFHLPRYEIMERLEQIRQEFELEAKRSNSLRERYQKILSRSDKRIRNINRLGRPTPVYDEDGNAKLRSDGTLMTYLPYDPLKLASAEREEDRLQMSIISVLCSADFTPPKPGTSHTSLEVTMRKQITETRIHDPEDNMDGIDIETINKASMSTNAYRRTQDE